MYSLLRLGVQDRWRQRWATLKAFSEVCQAASKPQGTWEPPGELIMPLTFNYENVK